MEEYKEMVLKKRNRAEKLKKNVLLLKLFQRNIIDQQLNQVGQNILNLMNLKENYQKIEFIEYKI